MTPVRLLKREDSLLTVVDVQEKLAATMAEREAVLAHCDMLVRAARRLDVPVVVTEQYPRGLGRTEPALLDALGAGHTPIEKLAFGCCGEPLYSQKIRESARRKMILCGMETHVCILQTCLSLMEEGYEVHVAADAVCSRSALHKSLALEQMRQAGAVVTSAESVVFQWLERAGTPEFKDILRLVK